MVDVDGKCKDTWILWVFQTLGFQTPLGWRLLEPKNIPKTPIRKTRDIFICIYILYDMAIPNPPYMDHLPTRKVKHGHMNKGKCRYI